MKTKLMGILLAGLVLPCFAESTSLKNSYCQAVPKGSVGQCFRNLTGKAFKGNDYELVEQDVAVNGASSFYKYPLDGFGHGDYINVSMPTKFFTTKQMAMMDFTLQKDGKPLPGCTVKLSATAHPKVPVLAIKEKNGQLQCQA